ncbi:MAG: DNA-processing protein DprA [Lachnospiraceae bacterium]|nr:DNA-processing protein DprA [Lachnospiraceae bacterium]
MEERVYAFWLHTLHGIGLRKASALLQVYDTVENIYHGNKNRLSDIPCLNEKDKENLVHPAPIKNLKDELDALEKRGIRFCWMGQEDYPVKLREIPDAPFGLFYRGHLPLQNRPVVAVVGGRNASHESREIARSFGRQLAENGISVVSGLAQGVDISAQRGALEIPGGRTYAVLGNGIDICFPRQHIEPFMQMQQKGGVISEYPPGTPGLAGNFAFRNRIISGLSDGVLVIGAREGSGSLITAECALEQGREVFVVPGKITDTAYAGGNKLLKSGAAVVTDIQDILDGLGLFLDDNVSSRKKKNKVMLETTEKMVYAILGFDGIHISEIVGRTGITVPDAMEALLSLERKQLIVMVGQHYYALRL